MKLTHEIRNLIVTKAFKDYKAAEKAQLEKDVQAFGLKAWASVYGDDAAAIKKAGISSRWYETNCFVHIECEGFSYRNGGFPGGDAMFCSSFNTLHERVDLGQEVMFPGSNYNDQTVQIEEGTALWAESRKLVKRYTQIREGEDDLRQQAVNLLRSCTTIKQLEAAWPEAMQFLPQNLSTSTALVPVGLSDKINKALGIPSKASVATAATRAASVK